MGRASRYVFLAVALLLAAAPALAAEEGGSGDLFNTTIGWVFRWLQFAILFGGLGYLIWKKAPAFFRARAETIVAAITEAAKVKEEAERRLREAEDKLARLDQELAALREAAQRDAAAEAERIREATRAEAAKIERAAQMEIEATERAARIELKAMAARLAIDRAEALIRRQMTPQTESALVRAFVEGIAGRAN